MGQATQPEPVLLLMAAFSRHPAALDWARRRAVEAWGPLALESPAFEFDQTDYYQPTMGSDLRKIFFTFSQLIDPGDLVELKLASNRWEEEYAELSDHDEPRPLNLDPGYMTPGKLVLASTKGFANRIYLGRGIHAEITLYYRHGRWQHNDFTFGDYRRDDYQRFFSECRQVVQTLQKEGSAK